MRRGDFLLVRTGQMQAMLNNHTWEAIRAEMLRTRL